MMDCPIKVFLHQETHMSKRVRISFMANYFRQIVVRTMGVQKTDVDAAIPVTLENPPINKPILIVITGLRGYPKEKKKILKGKIAEAMEIFFPSLSGNEDINVQFD